MTTSMQPSSITPTQPDAIGLFCDIGDLVFYIKRHQNVSGIQRVICSIVSSVKNTTQSVTWCMVDPVANELRQIDTLALTTLIDEISSPNSGRDKLDQLILKIEQSLIPCSLTRGDFFIILGAFWVFDHASSVLLRMRRSGVRTALLVYDIIPIQHPEFCERSLTKVFGRQLRSILPLLDCAVTISEHVRKQFVEYAAMADIHLPVRAVSLGHDNPSASILTGHQDFVDLDGEYVLAVGTIEIRKNHIYLLNIWKQLLAERQLDEVPKLVIVGRQGWRVRDLMEQLEATDYLDGHVIILDSITDAKLDELYRGCLFTMFVSFTEGWGLPVGESLSRGKLCVASSATSIPEIGGNLPIYIDPYNTTQGKEVVIRLLDDRAFLADKTRAIVESFRPRSWNEYTINLFDTFYSIAPEIASKDAITAVLPEAKWLYLGAHLDPNLDAGLACTEGWFPKEDWGRWMSARDARIEFRGTPNSSYRIIADIAMPPWLDHRHGLLVHGEGVEKVQIDRIPSLGGLFRTSAVADQNGKVTVRLRCLGPAVAHPSDPRTLYLGLKRLIFYSLSDPLMFVRGVEHVALGNLQLLG